MPPTARRRGWCSISPRPTARAFCAMADLTASRPGRRRRVPARRLPSTADPRPLVVLDPGHGGIDTGTKAPAGELEKDIVLNFAQRLARAARKAGKYRVLMTRTDDTFVPLADRVRIARNAGAALFVSIHADALPRREGDAQGATVYTLSDTAIRFRGRAARRKGKPRRRHRRRRSQGGARRRRRHPDRSRAARNQEPFRCSSPTSWSAISRPSTRLHKTPLKSAGFRVLRAPDVPSVLVELGYVSNKAGSAVACCRRTGVTARPTRSRRPSIRYFTTHVAGVLPAPTDAPR